jgi:hypothetical protein
MHCMKYWLKILKSWKGRYVKICCKMLLSTEYARYFNEIKHYYVIGLGMSG